MAKRSGLAAACLLAILGTTTLAQESTKDGQYVTREEYEKLKQQMQTVLAELESVKKQVASQPASQEEEERRAQIQQDLDDLHEALDAVRKQSKTAMPGETKFLLTGYGSTGYTDRQKQNSTFGASFNPIFLWQVNDRLLFEGELELTLARNEEDQSETDLSLEYANISYILNDHVTLGAGKFLLPIGVFNQELHPAWINKLPDRPLPYDDEVGIAPESGIGAFARGAFATSCGTWKYDAFVTNGPELITNDPANAGKLDFDNFEDSNNNKAVGARIGYLPIPELEMGYSFQVAKVSPTGFQNVNSFIQAADVEYKKEVNWLRGTIDARAEWVWSRVDQATYDPTGELGFGPVRFKNDRNAGYLQLAYRPTKSSNKTLRNLEFVGRYDVLNVPHRAPGGVNERRWTLGVDYWVTPSFVLKAAYEIDQKEDAENDNVFFLQAALGF